MTTAAQPAIYLISGPMAAGKSTVARALAGRFARGVHLEGDVFRRSIVSGRAEMTPDASAQALAEPLRAALPGARVEHVGSTAVPGFAAKPVVDLDVVLGSPGEVPAAIEALAGLGYVYQGDKGIPGRETFLWPPSSEPHRLYVVVGGGKPHRDHVDFRDHRRAHPEVARDYAALKRKLAARFRDD